MDRQRMSRGRGRRMDGWWGRLVDGAAVAALVLVVMAGLPAEASSPFLAVVNPNVNASKMTGNQAEATVAINPTNPSNVVILSNIDVGNGLLKMVSTNGGATWTTALIATGGADPLGTACCDPSAAFDRFGNLFLTYLDSTATDVQLALSINGGASFSFVGTIRSAPRTPGRVYPTRSGGPVDQPSVATGAGSVWVTYKEGNTNLIEARGAPVTGLGAVGAFNAAQSPPGSTNGNFGDVAIGPGGQVMVTYQSPSGGQGPSTIFVNVDADGLGAGGFGSAITVTSTNVGGFDFIPAQSGRSVDAEAGLAWDRSGGPQNGRVYLVYTDEAPPESNDTNIFVRFSDNNGSTWSAPLKVNDDATTRSQFNPRIALDQTSGNLAVTYHDSRSDGGVPGSGSTDTVINNDAQFWGAISTDGGASFSVNFAIGTGVSNAAAAMNGVDYGDYTGLDFSNGRIQPAWADNSNSTGDNPSGTLNAFDVYTARVMLPVSFIGVYRPGTNTFFLRNSFTTAAPDFIVPFGASGDMPVVGDWNGDGIDTIGLARPGSPAGTNTFFLRNTNSFGVPDITVAGFGASTDQPVVGDWDGNGTTTIGLFRPGSTNTFFLRNSNSLGAPDITVAGFGTSGDLPVVGDWDGNGMTTIGLYRPSTNTFFLRNSNSLGAPDLIIPFGAAGDTPVVGDWTGDGITKVGVFRPGTNQFFRRLSNGATSGVQSVSYGASGDTPVAGHWAN